MRITNSMMSQNLLYNLNQIQQSLSISQEQIATGKVLNKPSDNPLAVAEDMADTTAISQAQSYLSNIQFGTTWMNSTTSVLQSMTSTVQSLRNIVLQAINTAGQTPTATSGLQQEAAQLVNNLYQLSDTKQGNSYLFGGYATDKQVSQYISTTQLTTNASASSTTTPIVATGGTISVIGLNGTTQVSIANNATLQDVANAINGASNQTGVNASLQTTGSGVQLVLTPQEPGTAFGFTGNNVTLSSGSPLSVQSVQTGTAPSGADGIIKYSVSQSIQEQVNVTANQIFNQTPAGGTQTLQATLQSVINDIGNPSALQNDLGNLDASISQLIQINTELGSRINQMSTLQTQTNAFISNTQNQQASLEDANMAQVLTQYQNNMATYQAALQMGAKMILPTLAQYIQ